MSRFLIPGVMIVGGGVLGLTVLSALGDYLAELTGSELLGSTIVIGPLLVTAAVLGLAGLRAREAHRAGLRW